MADRRVRVLLIDKNLVDPANYQKWNLLAQKPGVELHAVTPAEWVENSRVIKFSDTLVGDFPVLPLRVVWRGKENRSFYLAGLGNEMKRFGPDIIVCFEEPFSLFALQTLLLSYFSSPKSKLIFYSWDNLAKGHDYPYRPRLIYRSIEKFILRRADLLLTANEEGRQYFQESYPIPVKKLYFGVNIDGPLRKNETIGEIVRQLPAGGFRVGYVGRLLYMKGIDILIRAVSMIGGDTILVIIGSGPDEQRLKDLVAELALEKNVVFIPAVPTALAKPMMAMLGVLVLPSKTTRTWKEQYGRVLVESMSLGVPVIGSDSGAIPEVIGDCGLIFHEGDAASLAESIRRVRYDEELRRDLSRRGLARSQTFSSAEFADHIYDELLELNA